MGGKESTPGQEEKDQVPKINHQRFQNIKFTRKDDQDCIQVKQPVANIKQYNQWVQSLKDAPIQSQNFLLPLGHQFQKQGFCGSSGFVNILYQNFPYVLADQIRNRSCLKQKFFDEPQLWYLIYTLISAGHQFHKSGRKVGDVRPENVFINEDGQVKVATQLTWPSENTNYYKTFYEKQLTYLAPEELKDIQFGKMEPSCNPKLAQSFSVGLTCLDAGTLSNSHQLYAKNNQFNYDQLPKRLNQLNNAGYSQLLNLVVANLCQPDCDKRSTCSQIFTWLQPYQEDIINLQSFQVSSLPAKLSQASGYVNQEPSTNRQVAAPVYQSFNENPPNVIQGHLAPQFNYSGKIDPKYLVRQQPHYSVAPQQYSQQVTYYTSPTGITTNPQLQGHQFISSQTINQNQVINGQIIQPGQQHISFPAAQQVVTRQVINNQTLTNQGQVLPQSQSQASQQNQVNRDQPVDTQGQGQVKTTTSTYTYTQPPQISSQYSYQPPGTQYTRPPVPATSYQASETGFTTGVGGRSNIELTLQKIDEQLQMSRKMFPS